MGGRQAMSAALVLATLTALHTGAAAEDLEPADQGGQPEGQALSTDTDPEGMPDATPDATPYGNADGADPDGEPVVFVYKPPAMVNPAGRIPAVTRSQAADIAAAYLVAPDHVAWTRVAAPDLHFFFLEPVNLPVEILLIAEDAADPDVEVLLTQGYGPGFHSISLDDLGVTLEFDRVYEWSVSVVTDPSRRWLDEVSIGAVQRVEPDVALAEQLASADLAGRAALFAANGYWYDMTGALFTLMARYPDEPHWPALLAGLLEAAGIGEPGSLAEHL